MHRGPEAFLGQERSKVSRLSKIACSSFVHVLHARCEQLSYKLVQPVACEPNGIILTPRNISEPVPQFWDDGCRNPDNILDRLVCRCMDHLAETGNIFSLRTAWSMPFHSFLIYLIGLRWRIYIWSVLDGSGTLIWQAPNGLLQINQISYPKGRLYHPT